MATGISLGFAASWNALILSETLSGLLLIAFSLVRGKVSNRFGGGWRSLVAKTPAHMLAIEEKDKQ